MYRVNQSMLKPGIVASKVTPNGVDLKVFHPASQIEARVDLLGFQPMQRFSSLRQTASERISGKTTKPCSPPWRRSQKQEQKCSVLHLGKWHRQNVSVTLRSGSFLSNETQIRSLGITKQPTSTSTPCGAKPSRPYIRISKLRLLAFLLWKGGQVFSRLKRIQKE